MLPNPQHALGTVVTCYVLWGMGVPLAMTVLVLYYHRLAVHKLPPREIIVSSFLPLGPLGFGGYTYDVLIASTASRKIANVRQHCISRQSLSHTAAQNKHDTSARRSRPLRARSSCGAHYVGFRSRLAGTSSDHHCQVSAVPIQYGLVG